MQREILTDIASELNNESCWELCGLVSDQYMSACPVDPDEVKAHGDSLA